MIEDFIDTYGRQARLAPALLTLFPIFIIIATWFPSLYELATGLIGLAIACGVTTAFAHFARSRGRKIQSILIKEWGMLPATLWLRKIDNNLDIITKQRYYNFLESHIPNWHAPTLEEEKNSPIESNQKYNSAIRWLLECPSSCNWNKERADLKEYLAHLVQYIKRRICGIASAGFPLFSV